MVSTIGLVIHSIADGLALGASLYRKTPSYINDYYLVSEVSEEAHGLGFVIFLAILLHHAPTAIGFGTFLLHERLNNASIIKHLFVSLVGLI